MNFTDIVLMKTAYQISLTHTDNDFTDAAIHKELCAQGINADDNLLGGLIIKMLSLDLLEVSEIGALYRVADPYNHASEIEITIVPKNDNLHNAVLEAIMKAIKPFGDLVDVMEAA